MSRDELTQRELEVLRGMADGETTADIARRLHVSFGTAHRHQQSLYERLGVHTGPHAVAEGFRRGILTIPEEDR